MSAGASKLFTVGQLVVADFDNKYMLTYSRAPIDTVAPTDVRFYSKDIAVIVSTIDVPDSFYTAGYAMILIPQGSGWVPFRWLKSLT